MENNYITPIALKSSHRTTVRRIPFVAPYDHDYLVATALWHARQNPTNGFGRLLSMLEGCQGEAKTTQEMQEEQQGASYLTLCRIARATGMSEEDEEEEWISLAESIPLSQRLARHILRAVVLRNKATGWHRHRKDGLLSWAMSTDPDGPLLELAR